MTERPKDRQTRREVGRKRKIQVDKNTVGFNLRQRTVFYIVKQKKQKNRLCHVFFLMYDLKKKQTDDAYETYFDQFF